MNVTKIVGVQKKLQKEAQKRNAEQKSEIGAACAEQKGHVLLMVDAPYRLCPQDTPCWDGTKCIARAEDAGCQDRSPQSIAKLSMDKLRLFAQCHSPEDEPWPVSMH